MVLWYNINSHIPSNEGLATCWQSIQQVPCTHSYIIAMTSLQCAASQQDEVWLSKLCCRARQCWCLYLKSKREVNRHLPAPQEAVICWAVPQGLHNHKQKWRRKTLPEEEKYKKKRRRETLILFSSHDVCLLRQPLRGRNYIPVSQKHSDCRRGMWVGCYSKCNKYEIAEHLSRPTEMITEGWLGANWALVGH